MGRPGSQPPPIFHPRDFSHTCSADRGIAASVFYYVRPPQNGIASYTYAIEALVWFCGGGVVTSAHGYVYGTNPRNVVK